jgi:tetratricopeptide (TPR) repeat protein
MIPLVERVGLQHEIAALRNPVGKPTLSTLVKNLELARRIKEDANALFKQSQIEKAILRYMESADLVDLEYLGGDYQKIQGLPVFKEVLDHIVTILSNLGNCFEKQELYFRVNRATTLALSIISKAPHPLKSKILLRRGKAYAEIGRYSEAMNDLLEARKFKAKKADEKEDDIEKVILEVEEKIQLAVKNGSQMDDTSTMTNSSPIATSSFQMAIPLSAEEELKKELAEIASKK